ncbi:MAG TPA: hypothetical protein VFZ48_02145 [Candidatus Saccharimonadales bacterium]
MRFDNPSGLMPRVVPWSLNNTPLDSVMATLSMVPRRVIVRITGGCANMSDEDAQGVLELFEGAFVGFDGALLIGGTRTIFNKDPGDVLFGITEVGPALRRANPQSFVLGVVPRCESFGLSADPPMIVVTQEHRAEEIPDRSFMTIVHPDQDIVIAALTRLTQGEIWDDEVEFCRYMTDTLVTYGRWRSLLVAYNGGGVTEREVRSTAARGEPVLLVSGSGRVCDKLAQDEEFLRQNPSVVVCERNVASMRQALKNCFVVD